MNIDGAVNKKDQMLMQLAHYFITQEDYTPMVVRGVKNEIWLENVDKTYKIIRINTNYIHNNEQLNFDILKIKNIARQVKKRTLSLRMKTLNILLDVGTSVEIKDDDKVDCIKIDSKGVKKNKKLNELYPELKDNLIDASDGIEFLLNVTNDINEKTERENREFEEVFRRKSLNITYILIAINALIFILGNIGYYTDSFDLFTAFALKRELVQSGEIYRLITAAFSHESIIHFGMNMYALYIIGSQVESYIGKWKYLFVYLFSGIVGNLLSCIVTGAWSLGASGAIFGLMGALLYFGLHYRLYLDTALKTQIVPLIVVNLAIGFMVPNIDSAAHIGGLIGGLFSSMAVGIKNKSSKIDMINGTICSIILISVLSYLLLIAK